MAMAPVGRPADAKANHIILSEEEVFDVSLATFYVFDKERAAPPAFTLARACGRCGGCARCAAGRCAVGRCAVGRCVVGRCAVGACCRLWRRLRHRLLLFNGWLQRLLSERVLVIDPVACASNE